MQNFRKPVTISVPETDPYAAAPSYGTLLTVNVRKAISSISHPFKKFKNSHEFLSAYQDFQLKVRGTEPGKNPPARPWESLMRFRIHMFLALLGPDPDLSVTKQK
jgi:hypothetical protein